MDGSLQTTCDTEFGSQGFSCQEVTANNIYGNCMTGECQNEILLARYNQGNLNTYNSWKCCDSSLTSYLRSDKSSCGDPAAAIDEFTKLPEKFKEIITPGRQRLLARSNTNEIEWDFNQDIYEISQFINGAKVFHKKYGYGKIINIDGNLASVKFDKSAQKQIFIKYLKPVN